MKIMGLGEWLLLIILSILWGGSFFLIEVIVEVLPPLTIVGLRVGLAALVLLHIIVRAMGLNNGLIVVDGRVLNYMKCNRSTKAINTQ